MYSNPNRVKFKVKQLGVDCLVFVEGIKDKTFWYFVLQEFCPSKDFHFERLNKSQIIREFIKVKSDGTPNITIEIPLLGCIDADYDYLFDNPAINHTNIIHTYTHSKENYSCEPNALNKLLVTLTYAPNDKRLDFLFFIENYSLLLYPVLLELIERKDDTIQYFGKNIQITSRDFVKDFIDKYQVISSKYPISDVSKSTVESLRSKDVSEIDCYLYIRGHDLFEIVADILERGRDRVKREAFIEISKRPPKPKEQQDARNEVINLFDPSRGQAPYAETLLETNYRHAFKYIAHLPPLQKLKKRIEDWAKTQ